MTYTINKLPDFYSVRNAEQINYSFEGMEGQQCFCFFDNGFSSNIIEPNKRDIKFIWDGFILFTSPDITLKDLQNGINLYDARLVALQRTNNLGYKSNNDKTRQFIIAKLESLKIPYTILPDNNLVSGYPSKSDLWSTRDKSVLLDAIDCTGYGPAYYFYNENFSFEIKFNKSNIPNLLYSHEGALVLHGKDSTAISRLLCNDEKLQEELENLVGSHKLYSYLEGKNIPGLPIKDVKKNLKKIV